MFKIKSILAILIVACLMAGSALAQDLPEKTAFKRGWHGNGIKLGVSLVNVTNETGIRTVAPWKVGFGPSMSIYLAYQFSPRFAFQHEVIFSQRGYQRGLEKEIFNQALSVSASVLPDYLNLNPFMTFSFNEKFHIFAGPTFGTMLSGSGLVSLQDEDDGEFEGEWEEELEEEFEDEFEDGLDEEFEEGDIDHEDGDGDTFRMDTGLALGAEYSLGRMSLSARYSLGLSLINDPTFGIKNHVFQVMLWYKF